MLPRESRGTWPLGDRRQYPEEQKVYDIFQIRRAGATSRPGSLSPTTSPGPCQLQPVLVLVKWKDSHLNWEKGKCSTGCWVGEFMAHQLSILYWDKCPHYGSCKNLVHTPLDWEWCKIKKLFFSYLIPESQSQAKYVITSKTSASPGKLSHSPAGHWVPCLSALIDI